MAKVDRREDTDDRRHRSTDKPNSMIVTVAATVVSLLIIGVFNKMGSTYDQVLLNGVRTTSMISKFEEHKVYHDKQLSDIMTKVVDNRNKINDLYLKFNKQSKR